MGAPIIEVLGGEAAGVGRGVAAAVPVGVNVEVAVGAKVDLTFEKLLHPDIAKQRIIRKSLFIICSLAPNGLRYLRVGGRGLCLRAGKTQSQKNACKSRRIPHVGCTLC